MAKNRKVKGFCGFCGDPVITGGAQHGTKWYHNPCYVAHSYGGPQEIRRGAKPRRSAPPRHEIRQRSEEDLNPVEMNPLGSFPGQRAGDARRRGEEERGGMNPVGIQPELEILAHSNNVSFGMNPMRKGSPQQYYIWQGPRAASSSIVRFPTYNQANQYYRDVIDGKIGVAKNPSRFRMRPIFWIAGLVGVAALAFWLYKRRSTVGSKVAGIAAKMAAAPRPPDSFGGAP